MLPCTHGWAWVCALCSNTPVRPVTLLWRRQKPCLHCLQLTPGASPGSLAACTAWPVSLRSTQTVTTLQCSGRKSGILSASTAVCNWRWASPHSPNTFVRMHLPQAWQITISILLLRWPRKIKECRGCYKNTLLLLCPLPLQCTMSVLPQKTSCTGAVRASSN